MLSLPWDLRRLAAYDAAVTRWLARLWADCVFRHFRRRFRGVGRAGAVNFVQRAGGSINLNAHFHLAALDGVFRSRGDRTVFRPADPPTREELFAVVEDFRERCRRGLRRRGLLDETGAAAERSPCFDGLGALDACAGAATQRGLFESRDEDGSAAPEADEDAQFGAPEFRPGNSLKLGTEA